MQVNGWWMEGDPALPAVANTYDPGIFDGGQACVSVNADLAFKAFGCTEQLDYLCEIVSGTPDSSSFLMEWCLPVWEGGCVCETVHLPIGSQNPGLLEPGKSAFITEKGGLCL